MTLIETVLNDGKPAIQVDELPNSPFYLRVRRTVKKMLVNSPTRDVFIAAEAYRVDEEGVILETGTTVTASIHGGRLADGTDTIANQLKLLKDRAIEQAITFFNAMKDLDSVDEDLTIM